MKKYHELKCWEDPFQSILDGDKGFEYRLNDRDYKEGDVLVLNEWRDKECIYTGRVVQKSVDYLVSGPSFGIPEKYCIMSWNSTQTKKVEICMGCGESYPCQSDCPCGTLVRYEK